MDPKVFEQLLDISREMAENRDLDPLLHYAMRVALELCDGEFGYLVLVNEDGSLDFRVKEDRRGSQSQTKDPQISHTIFEKVLSQGKPTIIADASYDPNYRDAESVLALRLRSVMCVPLISRGTPVGAIYIENRAHRNLFDEEDLKPMEYFAAQAAVSIENAKLNTELEARVARRTAELNNAVDKLVTTNERLEEEIGERQRAQEELHRLAITDSLTGIYNRGHFFVLGEQIFTQAIQDGLNLAALMVDADYFKSINDQFGHAIGDLVLRTLADRLSQHLRTADILGRYGGEEFSILMPETNLEEALQIAERLRQDIESQPIQSGTNKLALTISIGVASLEQNIDRTIDGLIDRADQALYAAKQAGRNQVTRSTAPT